MIKQYFYTTIVYLPYKNLGKYKTRDDPMRHEIIGDLDK